jgi:hypothetical protein
MKSFFLTAPLLLGLGVAPAFAQEVDPLIQAAIDSGICGEAPVATAVLNAETNQIDVTCEEDVVGFVPLAGAVPALAGAAAALLAALGGGGGPSDTQ